MRDATNKILEMIDEGLLDARTVVSACLKYMSEDDVEDMARMNEFLEEPEEETPYLINAGDSLNDLYPYLVSKSSEEAIAFCKNNKFYKYMEVVYMPENDIDTNDVIWRSWED